MSAVLPLIATDGDIVGLLLREQQSMTAVDQFSVAHDSGLIREPAQERYYSRLMPASSPQPNQQYAFNVDLDVCSGCKACVVACHNLNGLEESETWRSVGLLVGDNTIQHVTTACHHCDDPGCLNGCPVKAYVKDEVTGIVRHLDDQCIGCKYCTMMCPYEVPKYSDRLGIVRKCDMCHQRLSANEAPACVQACPNEAITIRIVDRPDVRELAGHRLAPGAPPSSITRPTTVYTSRRPQQFSAAKPQDTGIDHVAESHWPLAVMLVATQAAIGLLVVERLTAAFMSESMPPSVTRTSAALALVIAAIGMNVAPLHLGQPLRAWRVFLGLRTSWLSREAVVLGAWMGLLSAAVAMLWLPLVSEAIPTTIATYVPDWAATATLTLCIPIGLFGFYCSAMIYIATRRQIWSYARTMTRFAASMFVLGIPALALAISIAGESIPSSSTLAVVAIVASAFKLAFESYTHYRASGDEWQTRSSRLIWGPLRRQLLCRLALAGVSLVLLGWAAFAGSTILLTAVLALSLATLLSGETAERLLYFASVVHHRMPGTLA